MNFQRFHVSKLTGMLGFLSPKYSIGDMQKFDGTKNLTVEFSAEIKSNFVQLWIMFDHFFNVIVG